MTSLLGELYDQVFETLKEQYPYVQNETNLKKALMIIRECEEIKGDFSEQYAEIDNFYREPSPEEIAESKRRVEELAKKIGMAGDEEE